MRIAPRLRRRAALWLCPELAALPPFAAKQDIPHIPLSSVDAALLGMVTKTALITLANTLAHHDGVTHYAISMRALKKGDFFKGLMEPDADCRTRTAARLFIWFDANWPSDLEWPRDIPRPKSKQEAR